jgi:hypothetical protein
MTGSDVTATFELMVNVDGLNATETGPSSVL